MHRMYENEDIVIFWNSDKCFHAKQCVEGSPKTFRPGQKPWICLEGSDTKAVWQAISKCPSGALSCLYKHDIDVVMEPEACRSVAFDGSKEIGECDYIKSAKGWNIVHTGVSQEYTGKGIAKRLVYKVIEEAERNKENVTASCSYAVKILEE
ncbi:GNAT family N-acetyltransferase [Butyrivibrio sp. MC2021]|uniref:GNAT family N-acetyltransferase n=1 Tax=Butyrivibrio sp. MC2021 TaxID=1408306 RepID=UPI0009E07627|nr:GNAT family N-acetyltransferase [Butyrivibrio sp. MC2021]